MTAHQIYAQQPRIRFPSESSSSTPTTTTAFQSPGVTTTPGTSTPGSVAVPSNTITTPSGTITTTPNTTIPTTTVAPNTVTAPPGTNSTVLSFDPYSNSAATSPSLLGTPATGTGWSAPTTASPGTLAPPPNTGVAGNPVTAPYGTAVPPQNPPALFPNGLSTWNPNTALGTQFGQAPMRLLYGPRARYTWVYPKSGDREFGSNDFDFSATLAFPNFLWSGQPILITPAFGLHLWDGPKPPVQSDLPSSAYDAYLDFGWSTDPTKIFAAELGVRTGVFTDFNTFENRSFRLQALGHGLIQVTPSSKLKLGVIWLNRNRIKLLPAFGVLWEPNERTKWDIYFPRPKFSKFCSTFGNYDVWWYIGAEYGGGSWTIEHPDGGNDSIDINDIRVLTGFEWGQSSLMKKGRRLAFIEGGWVTEREIVYVVRPEDTVNLSQTFFLRAGIGY